MALLLDLMAAMLSGGQATHQIPRDPDFETGLSQVFIAMNLTALDQNNLAAQVADQIIGFTVDCRRVRASAIRARTC